MILVDYLNKDELRNLFRLLGLANATPESHIDHYGLNQYAEDLLRDWINGRDNVLNNPEYPGGATWENLRKALTQLGHYAAVKRVLSLRPSRELYQGSTGTNYFMHYVLRTTCWYYDHPATLFQFLVIYICMTTNCTGLKK